MAALESMEYEPTAADAGDTGNSDKALIRQYREGSSDAATDLYRRYARRLIALAQSQCSANLARQVEPEDILQSVFIAFFQGVRRGQYDVPENGDLWHLLLVIALNKIRKKGAYHLAAKRDSRVTKILDKSTPLPIMPLGQDEASVALMHLAVRDAFEHLPEPHRRAMELRIEGYEVAEIAERTGRSKRTIERILKEARDVLSGLFEEGK